MATLTDEWKTYATASFTGGGQTVKFTLQARYTSRSVANNTTTVQTKLVSDLTGTSMYGQGYKFTCTYAPTVSGSGYWYFGDETITSGSKVVEHNDDGTKSITLKASAYNKAWGFTKNLSATVSLPKITRIATMKSATNFNDEGNPTITFTNPANYYVQPYLNFYNKAGTRVHQIKGTIAKHSSPYPWNLTDTQRNNLRSATNQQSSYKVAEGVQTFTSSSASSLIDKSANSIDKTFSYVNAQPGVTWNNTEKNELVAQYIGEHSQRVVENASLLEIDATPEVEKSATISKVTIKCGDNLQTITSSPYKYTFEIGSSGDVEVIAYDSRGLSSIPNLGAFVVIPYQKVKQNSFSFKRVEPTSSDVRLKIDSVYYQQTFGTESNVPTVKYKIGDSQDAEWITVPSSEYDIDTENNKLEIDYIIENAIHYRSDAMFYVEVSDLLSSWNNRSKITKGIPVFEFGDDEVQVNGDLLLADINRENVINVRDALGGSGGTTDYSLLTNKPQINGTTLSGNLSTSDIGITIPTQTSQLTNNSGFITNTVSDLTNYTKTTDLATVATSGSYNDLSNKPTIPSKTSDLTNDSGFISGITSSQVTTALGYTPQEEIDIIDVTSWTKSKMIDVFNHVQNGKLFRLKETTSVRAYYYDPIYFRVESDKITLDYIDNSNVIVRIEITYDGVNNPNKVTSQIALQERITSSNKLDYSLISGVPITTVSWIDNRDWS